MESGLIFDIQGHSVHDGPGCRTLVCLSGCPLRCSWCSNPEGQLPRPRLMYRAQWCVRSQRCVSACPHGAVKIVAVGGTHPEFARSLCNHCERLDCVQACPREALRVAGRRYTVDELMRILTRDQDFWGSQGGVTFGGGEPLYQHAFLLAVLRECRARYIPVALETCAHVETAALAEILEWTDWMFIDLKHMDSAAHRQGTGATNALILQNIAMIASSGWRGRLIIRVPLIPGYNDTADNLRATAAFLNRLQLAEVNLLPFHRLGASKYAQLGLTYAFAHCPSPPAEALQAAQHIFESAGLRCHVGSATPY